MRAADPAEERVRVPDHLVPAQQRHLQHPRDHQQRGVEPHRGGAGDGVRRGEPVPAQHRHHPRGQQHGRRHHHRHRRRPARTLQKQVGSKIITSTLLSTPGTIQSVS